MMDSDYSDPETYAHALGTNSLNLFSSGKEWNADVQATANTTDFFDFGISHEAGPSQFWQNPLISEAGESSVASHVLQPAARETATRGKPSGSMRRTRRRVTPRAPTPQLNSVEIPCANENNRVLIKNTFTNLLLVFDRAKYLGSSSIFRRNAPCCWIIFFRYHPIINAYNNTECSNLVYQTITDYLSNAAVAEFGRSDWKGKCCWCLVLKKVCDENLCHFNFIKRETVKTVATRKNTFIKYQFYSLDIHCKESPVDSEADDEEINGNRDDAKI